MTTLRGPSAALALLPAIALAEVLTAALATLGAVGLLGGLTAAALARVRRRDTRRSGE